MLTQMDQFETSALNRHVSTIWMSLTIPWSLGWHIYFGLGLGWFTPLSCATRHMHCSCGASSSFIVSPHPLLNGGWYLKKPTKTDRQTGRHGNGIKWSWIINRVWPVVWDQFEGVAQCLNFLIECDSEFPRISFNRQFACVALILSSHFTAAEAAASSTKSLELLVGCNTICLLMFSAEMLNVL